MKVKKTPIPTSCLLRNYSPADYTDSFRITTDWDITASPDDMMVALWLDMPGWVNGLFKLRNLLVTFVGLQGSQGNDPEKFEACIRAGKSYQFTEVPAKTAQETVLLMKDKHLNAYLSILKEDKRNVYANTLVQYNNRLGRIYFFVIRPFHGCVVRAMLKRIVGKRICLP